MLEKETLVYIVKIENR